MKKALIFILSAALILSALASCGAEPPKEEPTKNLTQSTQTDTPAASTPAPEPEQKPEQKTAPTPEPEPEETPKETQPAEPQLFTEVNETVYVVNTDSLNLRSGPGTSYDKVGSLARGESATRTGIGIDGTEAEGWSIVKLSDGSIVYVSSKYLSTTKPEAKSSGNSGGSNSKVSKAESKPSTASNQEAPAESSNSGVQGGLSAEDQAALEAALARTGGQKVGYQATEEEVRNGGTHASGNEYT